MPLAGDGFDDGFDEPVASLPPVLLPDARNTGRRRPCAVRRWGCEATGWTRWTRCWTNCATSWRPRTRRSTAAGAAERPCRQSSCAPSSPLPRTGRERTGAADRHRRSPGRQDAGPGWTPHRPGRGAPRLGSRRALAVVGPGGRDLRGGPAGQRLHLHVRGPASGSESLVPGQARLLELHQHLGCPLVRRSVIADGYPSELPVDGCRERPGKHLGLLSAVPVLGRMLSGCHRYQPRRRPSRSSRCSPAWPRPLVVYCLFRHRAHHGRPCGASRSSAAFPVSPVLQVPYAESLNLLLLAPALLLVLRRRYLWAMPGGPGDVPFPAHGCSVCGDGSGSLFLYRAGGGTGLEARKQGSRSREPAPRVAQPGTSCGPWLGSPPSVGTAPSLWPAIAWAATGDIARLHQDRNGMARARPGALQAVVRRRRPAVRARAGSRGAVRLRGAVRAVYGCPGRFAGWGWNSGSGAVLHGVSRGVPAPADQHLPHAAAAVSAGPGCRARFRSRAYRGAVITMFVLLQIVWIVWLWAWAQLPGGGDYPP